jgi:beta-galactosidase
LDPEGFSSADKVGTIMKNPEGEKVILKYFGTMVEHPKFAMMKAMTLDAMGKLKNLGIPQELIAVMNKELNQIKK